MDAGSFVGEIPDAKAFVAIVAAKPDGAGEAREVRGYLCDGQRLSKWFTGSVTGNELRLTSEEGDRLDGNLAADTATGEITLADGESFSFDAKPATGTAGLYTVTVAADGEVTGASEAGGRVRGRLMDELVRKDIHRVDFTITAGGQTLEFRGAATAQPGDARLIVLPDGRIKGARTATTTADSGYTNPDQDF